MVDKPKTPSEDQLRLLIDSMCGEFSGNGQDAAQVVNMLIRETVKFRDKLKEETGEILTVGDTQTALDALTEHLRGAKLPGDLTPEQKALTQIWIDRLTLFKTD